MGMANLQAQFHTAQPCIDSVVKKSADSVVRSLTIQGFSLMHSASLTMESDYESAIIVDLQKGNWYVISFVGANTSKMFQVTMFDSQEARVAYEKQKLFDKEANVLTFNYRPELSGHHLINPLQTNKKHKSVCGQIMLFKKERSQ